MRKISGNLSLVKKLNKQSILSIIKEFAPLSRADIAKKAKLNKATVSALIDELLQAQIIQEIGEGKSSGGRKPILLTLNDDAGCILGLDLQVNHLSIILTNLNGKVLWTKKKDISIHATQESTLLEMMHFIKKGIDLAPETPLDILGIGIALPGIVDHINGNLLMAPNLHWNNFQIKAYFEEQIDIPIFIDNEANVAALAEMAYGSGKNCNNLVYISAGIGIGAGIIIQRELYHGSQGYSGELGHMSIERDGLPCPCGNDGCWEMYASEKAFLNKIATGGDEQTISDYLTSEELNDDTLAALEEVGHNLGIGITNIIHSYNPEVIIIGNSLAEAGDLILKPIQKAVEKRCMVYVDHHAEIRLSELGDHARALGAATMVSSYLFDNHTSVLFG